jgi:type IX secretion system PorP/SprF family membrane protein
MNIKNILVSFLSALISAVSFAQQDPHFSHFMFNSLYYNAGYAGMEGVSRATLIHRSQWLGYESTNTADGGGAPVTQALNLTYPLKIKSPSVFNSGAGLSIINDKLGPVRNFEMKGSFAYNVKIASTGGVLGAGLAVGFWSQSIDGSLLRAADEDDVVVDGLAGQTNSQLKPDLSVGLWYKTKKYEGGVSLRHAVPSNYTYGLSSDSISSKLVQHMYVTGRYNIYTGTDILLSPIAILYTDFSEFSINYGILGSYKDMKYWGGLTLRQSTAKKAGDSKNTVSNNDIVILMGISLLKEKELRIGYSIDIVTGGAKAKSATSHEIMVSYVLPIGKDKDRAPLRSPRYRHEN